jgi:23S rRNA maturation mini-RNase III
MAQESPNVSCSQSRQWHWVIYCSPPHGKPLNALKQQLRSLSPLALAYVGDAVFELFVRSRFALAPHSRCARFHRQVVSHVRAEQQAHYLECLQTALIDSRKKDILRAGSQCGLLGARFRF